jgi:hydroxylaminobenzene mutase
MVGTGRQLCLSGFVLFALGLASGFLVPAVALPRVGLSAHLAGVQSGMLLVILGLVWPHLSLAGGAERAARGLAIASLYATWLGIQLAAAFGATGAMPLASGGAASSAAGWQEALAGGLVIGGAVASVPATALVLLGFRRRPA